MKALLPKLTTLFLVSSFSYSVIGQAIWQQKANLPVTGRDCAASFTIGQKGYIVGGGNPTNTFLNELWEYDPSVNTWTQKASLPVGRSRASGFSIGNKGYVVGGSNSSGFLNDLWEYDPSTNVWTQKAFFPGGARFAATAFGLNGKGYYGTGSTQIAFYRDFWEYDPVTNSWTQKENVPAASRNGARSFVIGNKGYVTGGNYSSFYYNDILEYNPATNTWAQKNSMPFTAGRAYAVAFSVNGKGYIATGLRDGVRRDDVWEYDLASDQWQQKGNFGGAARLDAISLVINNTAYVGTGYSGIYRNDFFQYVPCNDGIPAISISTTTNPLCENSSVVFTANIANGGSNPLLIWKRNGITVSSGSSLTATIPVHNNDIIMCQLIGPAPCSTSVNSNEITIATSSVTPSVYITSNVTSICEGGSAQFTTSYTNGGSSPSFQWKIDGIAVPGATQSTATIDYPYDDAVVTCEMTSNDPCASPATVTSNGVTLTIIAPTYADAGVDETVIGSALNLYGNEPAPGETGTWTIINGNGTLVNPSQYDSRFSGTIGNTYTLKWSVTNPQCGTTEDEVVITLAPMPASNTGKLYGMTKDGGNNQFGVIYEYDAINETLTKKYDFESDLSGRNPWGSLVQAYNGKLYGLTGDGGTAEGGVLFEFDPATSTYIKKQDFNSSLGMNPTGTLTIGPNGILYGLTTFGGANDMGTIFSYDPETNAITKLHDFNGSEGKEPNASLLFTDGHLFGTTTLGGANNMGTVFKFFPGNNDFFTLHEFSGTDGANPFGSLIEKNGHIYGTTKNGGNLNKGVIFEIEPSLLGFTKKLDLGGNPFGDLIDINGTFFGLTSSDGNNNQGTLFSYIPNGPGSPGGGIPEPYSFDGIHGAIPRGSLIEFNNRLYGVTNSGGTSSKGVLFEYHPLNHLLHKKADFDGTNGAFPEFSKLVELKPVPGANIISSSLVVCAASSVTLSESPATSGNTYQWLKDGTAISGATSSSYTVTEPGNYQLKVTNAQGYYSKSNTIEISEPVYANAGQDKIVPGTHTYLRGNIEDNTTGSWSIISGSGGSLQSMSNGEVKVNGQIGQTYTLRWTLSGSGCSTEDDVDVSLVELPFPYTGKLYGMTSGGGTNGGGVIYEYNTLTQSYTVKYSFNCATGGCNPAGSLIQTRNGKLYGMTARGGQYDKGVIFEFNPATNEYINRHVFFGSTGEYPQGSLVEGEDGKLYGMTSIGGDYDKGVLFAFDPENISLTVKHHFNGVEGANPNGSLILASDHYMYGTTVNGGSQNHGSLFKFNPVTADLSSITDLDKHPKGSPLYYDNKFYGLTSQGGQNNDGTLFEFFNDELSPQMRTIDLGLLGVRNAQGDLARVNITMFGLSAAGGENGNGAIFSVQFHPDNVLGFPAIYSFRQTDGIKPVGSLFQASNNILYGVTQEGGASGFGTLFEYDPSLLIFNKQLDLNFSLGGNPLYSKMIELLQVPVAGINALSSPHLCNGNSVVLTEYPLTTGNTYQWYRNGVAISGADAQTFTASTAGMYTLKVTNIAGMFAISGGVYVTVSNTTGTASAGTILCNGGTSTLTATASGGTAPYTYALTGSMGSTHQTSNNFTVPAGTYTVEIKDVYGCTGYANTVTINQPPAITGVSNAGTILCYGGTTTLTTNGSGGTGTLRYALTGSIGSTFQVSNVYTVPAGTYTVEIKDQNNCIGHANTVTVTQPALLVANIPDAYAVNPGGAPFTIYTGYGPNSITLTTAVTGGTGPYNYKWTSGTQSGPALSTASSVTVSPAAPVIYYLKVKDANGCNAATISRTVTLVDVRCGSNMNKVLVCQPRNNGTLVTSCLNAGSVASALNSGSTLGPCPTIARSESTGMAEDFSNVWSVKTFPNPSNSGFTLELNSDLNEVAVILISDLSGKQIEKINIVNSQVKFGHNYLPGVYVATILQGEHKTVVRLVKMR